MIYLHKILPLFILPFQFALIWICVGLLLKKRILIFFGLGSLYIFSMPITANVLMRHLESGMERLTTDKVDPADAIVVLSGSGAQPKGKNAVVEWQDPDRFLGGVALLQSQKAPLLVFTGGWLPWNASARPEGDVLIEEAERMGISRDKLLTTGKVTNTAGEAAAVGKILHERKLSSHSENQKKPTILLVTSAFHMQRAAKLFEREGLNVNMFPVDFRSSKSFSFSFFDLLPNAGALEVSETCMREIYGRLYYNILH